MQTPEAQTTDVTVCFDKERPAYSCRNVYPCKDYEGRCGRCLSIEDATDIEERKKLMTAPYCRGCSAISFYLVLVGEYCGTCARKLHPQGGSTGSVSPPTIPPPNQPAASHQAGTDMNLLQLRNAARSQAAQARFSKNSPCSSTNPSAAAIGGRTLQVTFQATTIAKTKIGEYLGNATANFAETTPFSQVFTSLVGLWNPVWEKECAESLTIEFVTIRLLGGYTVLQSSTLGTIGEFYDLNAASILLVNPKKPANVKGPMLVLQVLIDIRKFEAETGSNAPWFAKPEKEQRALKRKSVDFSSSVVPRSKLARTASGPPISRLLLRLGTSVGTTKINVVFGSIKPDDDGTPTVIWMKPGSQNATPAYLSDTEHSRGATKIVHKMVLDGQEYAAKRFYNLGKGSGVVSVEENMTEIEQEAFRLHHLDLYFKAFEDHARENRVTIAEDIRVTDFRLALEDVSGFQGQPSPASGVKSLDESEVDGNAQIAWLLEKWRGDHPTTKWSGTMAHPSHPGKIGVTLTAFAHFAYESSDRSLVFADLQSTLAGSAKECFNILFDVMCHTIAGDSGVGDHGLKGIQKFLDDHVCTRKCEDLGLKPLREPSGSSDKSRPATTDISSTIA
ncbi:hypothetical protein V5O48_003812 [Marasmius crinis-equi]|uniref:Alpha-type protein kinase domain-containing protein n=1 Tax=Marasmius crinis-equi TaxID=585013 RepID=A0ABR3FRS8_9AGAR